MHPFDEIQSAVADSFESRGSEMVSAVKELISVPVEYRRGPRGGRIVIRSKPGEPPRKESGALYESIDSRVEQDEGVTLVVSSDKFYAPILEKSLDREFAGPVLDEFTDPIIDGIVDAVQRKH